MDYTNLESKEQHIVLVNERWTITCKLASGSHSDIFLGNDE